MGNASSGWAYVGNVGGGGGIAAIIGGNTAGVTTSVSSGTLVLAGGNNITLSQNGQSVSIIGGAGGAGFSAGVSGGNTSGSTGLTGTNLYLAGGNNITLSQSTGAAGASVTISAFSQTVQTQASGNIAGTATAITGNASITLNSGGLSFNGSGLAGTSTGAVNISVTLNSSGISLSAPAVGGAQTAISGIIVSNTTYTSGTVSFSNANGITWGSSAGQAITASYNSTQFAGTGTSVTGNASITQNSNGIAFNGSNLAGVGTSVTGSLSITMNSAGIQFNGSNLVGNNTAKSGAIAFTANSSGISINATSLAGTATAITGNALITLNTAGLSFNGTSLAGVGTSITGNASITMNSAGIQFNGSGLAGTSTGATNASVTLNSSGIAISVGAGGGASTVGLYGTGNTTNNSSTTLALSSQLFNFLGGATGGFSNGSIQLSVPVISSLSATGLASLSVNGSTISVGAAIQQLSFFQPLGPVQSTTVTQNGAGSIQVYPAIAAFPFTATRADIMASVSAAVLAVSTQAQTLSMYIGLYSLNASTLSLASSGSQSYAWTNSSNNSNASITGMRRFSAPINVNYTGGFDLFVGVMTNTTFVNTNGISLSNVVVPLGPGPQLQGLIGQVPANSMQFVPGQGFFSTTSAAMPVSMALSAISGAGSGGNAVDNYVHVQFANVTA